MKTYKLFSTCLVAAMQLLVLPHATADIHVRASVKFILKPDGTRPGLGNIGDATGFATEVTYGNQILAARGYVIDVLEYIDIQPPVPSGQPADYWYNLDARNNRQTIENAALANQAVWRWNANAINIFVNNSSSGQCSFPGSGGSISLGKSVGNGVVFHEVGHIFALKHTHAGDYSDNTNPPTGVFTVSDLQDGDGLTETPNDNPNIGTKDQLCQALFGLPYTQPPTPPGAPFANAVQRDTVDRTYENVMSYHNETLLLTPQFDIWAATANDARSGFCNGKTWFVAMNDSDGSNGTSADTPAATVGSGLARVSTSNDIVLLRAGSYAAPPSGLITTPCTVRATRGAATIHKP